MIEKSIEFKSSQSVSTVSGNIEINQKTGEIVIRAGDKVVVRINSDGFVYSDQDGKRRILIGRHPNTGEMIEAISNPGVDVIDELKLES